MLRGFQLKHLESVSGKVCKLLRGCLFCCSTTIEYVDWDIVSMIEIFVCFIYIIAKSFALLHLSLKLICCLIIATSVIYGYFRSQKNLSVKLK